MREPKAGALIFILLFVLTIQLAAQDDPSIETDWDDISYDVYARGDQTFLVNLGVVFPVLFIVDGQVNNDGWRTVGGSGSLMFNYYLSPRLFLGGEIGIMFVNSVADNTCFIIPLGLRMGTQFTAGRFEFPLVATLGVSWQNFLNLGYFGMFAKASGSVLFKATTQWAFGITSSWYFIPQWTNVPNTDVLGNFVDLTLTARYHF